MKIHYLVNATGFVKTENNGYSGRSFTFDVAMDEPWNGSHGNLSDVAYAEFVKAFDCHPTNSPQIDRVIRIEARYDEAIAALRAIDELVQGAEQADVWEQVFAHDILTKIPDWIEEITEAELLPADEEHDDLI